MADEVQVETPPEVVPEVAPTPAPDDPYDLGDTEIRFAQSPVAAAPTPDQAVPEQVAINAAGRPYDPATGRLLPAESSPAPDPVATTHPAELVSQAQALHLDPDELNLSTAQLQRHVNRVLWEREQNRQRDNVQQTLDANQVQPQRVQPQEAEGDIYAPYEGTITPEILQLMRQQDQRIKDLEGRLGEVRSFQEHARQETLTDLADRLFAEHGNKAVVGEQSIRAMADNSKEVRIRRSVLAHAGSMAGAKARPIDIVRRIPDALKELGMGAQAQAPEQPPKPVKPVKNGKPLISPEEWARGGTAIPTSRGNAAEPKGEAKAIAKLDAAMRERGIHPDQHQDSEELDTLL